MSLRERAATVLRADAALPMVRRAEPLFVAVAAFWAMTAVHDVHYMLRTGYWTDEAWVAVTRRFSLGSLRTVTSSTPIGWSSVMRLFPDNDERMLALAFGAGAVIAAWYFARGLGWRSPTVSFIAAIAAAQAALFVPAMLVRNDLKQYTADACFALTVLALTSRLERSWSRFNVGAWAVAVAVGLLFSHTTAFVAVACGFAVLVVVAARRQWRQLIEFGVAGGGAAVAFGVIYEGFDKKAIVPGLTNYWRAYYVPRHPRAAWHFVINHLKAIQAYIGLGPAWLAVLLFVIGIVTLALVQRPITALAVAVLVPELIIVSAARKYPFLDERTSTFLIVIAVVTAAIGVVGVCTWIAQHAAVVGALIGVIAADVFIAHAAPYVNSHTLPSDDIRIQVADVLAQQRPGDVILVNSSSNWGMGYYWPRGPRSREPEPANLQGYVVAFPGQRIVVLHNRDLKTVTAGVDSALAQAGGAPARIWLVRSHVVPSESKAWTQALDAHGLTAVQVDRAGLSLITLP